MHITIKKLLQALPIVAALLLAALPAAAEDHPAMHDASEALRAAQTAADPLKKLEEAKRHLNQALNNKQGYRVTALKLTNDAIAATKAGKRVEAGKAITEALNAIEKGVALHPRDNKPRRKR